MEVIGGYVGVNILFIGSCLLDGDVVQSGRSLRPGGHVAAVFVMITDRNVARRQNPEEQTSRVSFSNLGDSAE